MRATTSGTTCRSTGRAANSWKALPSNPAFAPAVLVLLTLTLLLGAGTVWWLSHLRSRGGAASSTSETSPGQEQQAIQLATEHLRREGIVQISSGQLELHEQRATLRGAGEDIWSTAHAFVVQWSVVHRETSDLWTLESVTIDGQVKYTRPQLD